LRFFAVPEFSPKRRRAMSRVSSNLDQLVSFNSSSSSDDEATGESAGVRQPKFGEGSGSGPCAAIIEAKARQPVPFSGMALVDFGIIESRTKPNLHLGESSSSSSARASNRNLTLFRGFMGTFPHGLCLPWFMETSPREGSVSTAFAFASSGSTTAFACWARASSIPSCHRAWATSD